MANWTNIQTDRLEPGKPIRSIDGIALRDNPIAIAEGAAGAPRIKTAAIQDNAVTTAKINNNAVTNAKINSMQYSKLTNRPTRGIAYDGGQTSVSVPPQSMVAVPSGYVVTGWGGAGGQAGYTLYCRKLKVDL